MTRVVEIRELEDCLEDSKTFEVELEGPIDERLMRRLAEGGRLDFHPEFPRPYFRISRAEAWIVQGVLGNRSMRATGSPRCPCDPAEHLKRCLEEGEIDDGSEAQTIL
jgi:hypothetical protein